MSTTPNLPIGYWLKEADRVITAAINQAQAVNGVSRTEWQVLNTLAEGNGATRERLGTIVQPFVDAAGLDAIIARLTERGWVAAAGAGEEGQAPLNLTAEGQDAHAVILAQQQEVRRRAVAGVSREDYATVIRVLQQIVHNLSESEESNP